MVEVFSGELRRLRDADRQRRMDRQQTFMLELLRCFILLNMTKELPVRRSTGSIAHRLLLPVRIESCTLRGHQTMAHVGVLASCGVCRRAGGPTGYGWSAGRGNPSPCLDVTTLVLSTSKVEPRSTGSWRLSVFFLPSYYQASTSSQRIRTIRGMPVHEAPRCNLGGSDNVALRHRAAGPGASVMPRCVARCADVSHSRRAKLPE